MRRCGGYKGFYIDSTNHGAGIVGMMIRIMDCRYRIHGDDKDGTVAAVGLGKG